MLFQIFYLLWGVYVSIFMSCFLIHQRQVQMFSQNFDCIIEDTFNFTIFSFVTVGNGSFFKIYSKSYSIEFVSFLYHFDDLFNSIKIVQWSQILYGHSAHIVITANVTEWRQNTLKCSWSDADYCANFSFLICGLFGYKFCIQSPRVKMAV